MKILLVQIKGFENISLENEIKSFFESENSEVKNKAFDLSETAKIPEVFIELLELHAGTASWIYKFIEENVQFF